ncbi:GatB/YqeY domain-containing protein [Pseudodesulfovibrio sp. F-1]|uniref:GatB/YqeY domain-containing protein n=1 Tax=Pseudodesulfovibrio alkaliphilus TaxID=2661613 RepID=A0A7K1KQ38_9BACT|nr:GatB/YqeY domain-containing protein [Pseudodesulfovibrio alkaliphilus]MUM78215.1 GatB/YqeY domain-containing protein [Pseudodesulfovibrio alkaliphilus]
MSLLKKLDQDYIEAYKAKATVKVAVLRHLKTAIKTRMAEGRGAELTDDDILELIARQVKQRKDSFDQFTKAGRDDLAGVEAQELAELETYLPTPLGDDELAAAIDRAVVEVGATGIQDMGRVMQTLLGTHKGQVDGKKASALVRSRLSA